MIEGLYKSNVECIKDAIRQCEEDGDKLIYYCYGGPAYPTAYPTPYLLARLGIQVIAAAGDEIWNKQDVWTEAYNFAAQEKKLTEDFKKYGLMIDGGYNLGRLVQRVQYYVSLKEIQFGDFLEMKPEERGNAKKIVDQFIFDLQNGFPWGIESSEDKAFKWWMSFNHETDEYIKNIVSKYSAGNNTCKTIKFGYIKQMWISAGRPKPVTYKTSILDKLKQFFRF